MVPFTGLWTIRHALNVGFAGSLGKHGETNMKKLCIKDDRGIEWNRDRSLFSF